MLSGTAPLETLAAEAPVMTSLQPEPVAFEDAEVFQAAFEMPSSRREATLPPGLHPTTPPLLVVLAWRVPDSPWGPFTAAQLRVSCRSGVRPRGFVAACVTDSEAAARELSARWGLPARAGPVGLHRFYDATVLEAGTSLRITGLDPEPLGTEDVQYTVTTTLAHTPRGLRLVQVEPEYELRRVERVRPRLDGFVDEGWQARGLEPRHPVSASIGVGTLSIPRVRFVSRPDVTAFEGTESV